jgi:hypothetical protein
MTGEQHDEKTPLAISGVLLSDHLLNSRLTAEEATAGALSFIMRAAVMGMAVPIARAVFSAMFVIAAAVFPVLLRR